MPIPPPERPLPPEHPGAARFPKNLRDLIGWSATRVTQEVGAPDSQHAGDKWFIKDDGLGQRYMRQHDGRIIPQHWFGPRAPQGIALGQAYAVWRYNNYGRGSVGLLYLIDSPEGQVVVDVDAYPINAVF
ncbi:hypothetical protein [Prosthecobacter sp.]|uniref:hypothetical protein n=1 Tax=Prosthecobacter sp. TaxID=1965333 RepID=UPI002ABA1122|nr:hypothetical protein [Prosthecobacter sp.]MDZ4404271.1 hypothetical protein [Prosthecobacter sp.]